MKNKFLTAKHWQIFLMTYGLPLIMQIIFMGKIIWKVSRKGEFEPDILFSMITFFPIIMLLTIVVYFGWFWAVVIGLNNFLPQDLKLKLGRFKFALILPVIYIIFISFLIAMFMQATMIGFVQPSLTALFIIIPIHFLAMFCIFYCLYFVAKTIKTVEARKKVGFGDFIVEFFMIWFFPIGIWIIQPKINKLVEAAAAGK